MSWISATSKVICGAVHRLALPVTFALLVNSPQLLSAQPVASVSPTSLVFAAQVVGTSSGEQRVAVSNTGTAAMTVTSMTTTGDYAVTTNYCNNGVQSNSHCDIYVTFTPTAAGTRSGVLTIAHSAPGSPLTVSLSGTGTTPSGPIASVS